MGVISGFWALLGSSLSSRFHVLFGSSHSFWVPKHAQGSYRDRLCSLVATAVRGPGFLVALRPDYGSRSSVRFGVFRLTDPSGLNTILMCTTKEAFHPHSEPAIYTVCQRNSPRLPCTAETPPGQFTCSTDQRLATGDCRSAKGRLFCQRGYSAEHVGICSVPVR